MEGKTIPAGRFINNVAQPPKLRKTCPSNLKHTPRPPNSLTPYTASNNFNDEVQQQQIQIKMSIYSGFATRQQQQAYDNLIVDLISVLQRRIIKFYTGEQADEAKFHSILLNLQHHLTKMEDNKYLEPKMSNTFRELINLTSNVKVEEGQSPPQSQQQNRKSKEAPKESLNFSTDKIAPDLRYVGIGKIKHQSTSKQDGISSRGETNPQHPNDKNIVRSFSSHNPKQHPQKQNLQKWSNIYDKQPPAVPPDQKKNIQYIIREYVNKGRRRQKKKTGVE